jgi:hypothetical protein
LEAIKYRAIIEKDGEIRLTDVPFRKGQRVEMIILVEPGEGSVAPAALAAFDVVRINTARFRFDREKANER